MTQTANKAIQFKCEKCGYIQFSKYTLEYSYFEDRYVYQDHIQCEKCGHDNHVIQEL